MTALTDVVDKLTKPRFLPTVFKDDDGKWLGVHTVEHPSLLDLLREGTGTSQGPKSANTPLLIDADALEMWAQIVDRVRGWCFNAGIFFDRDDVPGSLRRWRAPVGGEEYAVRVMGAWIAAIERKFDPPRLREWQTPCPKCGVRRLVVDDAEVFAIEWNVTAMTATCRACTGFWSGLSGLRELVFFTNVDERQRRGEELEPETLSLLAACLEGGITAV
jgi:hypothetical protein